MTRETEVATRFNVLLSVAVLRRGFLGERNYYGDDVRNRDAYEAFGMARPRYVAGAMHAAALSEARCPQCHGACTITDVRDVSLMTFVDSFTDSAEDTVAHGTLSCATDDQHTDHLPEGFALVTVNDTVAGLVRTLDNIAAEMGY